MANHELSIAHLYGSLMNTYGDNGNLLMLKYIAKKMGASCHTEIVSIHEPSDAGKYDLVFFGSGQDFEQLIISKDVQKKKGSLINYIGNNGVMLTICNGYQLLGHYCVGTNGEEIQGISALDHCALSQENNRFIGDIAIHNEEFNETYYGFENHGSRTLLGEGERPLGKIVQGRENNGEDQSEGIIYRNVFGSYFHGPILARNENLATRLIRLALEQRYDKELDLPYFEGQTA